MSAAFVEGASLARLLALAILSVLPWLRLESAHAATPADRYLASLGANTVTDTRTKLVWRRFIEPGMYTWEEAKARCSGGFRLPSYKELLTLVDPTRSRPAISPVFRGTSEAEDTPSASFWTSSPFVGADNAAWNVTFMDGSNALDGDVTLLHHVRCVR